MQYWLFKSEPETFGIEDLMKLPEQKSLWDGVRNYQARNFMKTMQVGDKGLFYHSSCKHPGVYGVIEVVEECVVDTTQFDNKSDYYDAKATPEKPIWYCVTVKFVKKLPKPWLLQEIKQNASLQDMLILRKGNRLSITPVTKAEFEVFYDK